MNIYYQQAVIQVVLKTLKREIFEMIGCWLHKTKHTLHGECSDVKIFAYEIFSLFDGLVLYLYFYVSSGGNLRHCDRTSIFCKVNLFFSYLANLVKLQYFVMLSKTAIYHSNLFMP